MAGSPSCNRIALILANWLLLFQFNCTHTQYVEIKKLMGADLFVKSQIDDANKLLAQGFKRVSPRGVLKFERNVTTTVAIQGKCYDSTDCDRICSQLSNTQADITTGKKG
ncbi:hypothetical protein MKW94_001747 [Papaver nudicaule]|uniref:Uncharacterized protein n=1 Tax=Papaver nudicaule TaxID=74823 RepID=A0AA41VWE2_PAPNU|nr:hypothetical protein [Papaver nudicaule]